MENTHNPNNPNDFTAGGYSGLPENSETFRLAFSFLQKKMMKEHPGIKLLKVIKAEEQVVAGLNIGLLCEYRNKHEDKNNILYAKIYIDLQDNCELDLLEFDPGNFP